jgi:hypothetical protein
MPPISRAMLADLGAGSQIAWFASGSIGINFTRNIFLETGYRYFYMDYTKKA